MLPFDDPLRFEGPWPVPDRINPRCHHHGGSGLTPASSVINVHTAA